MEVSFLCVCMTCAHKLLQLIEKTKRNKRDMRFWEVNIAKKSVERNNVIMN